MENLDFNNLFNYEQLPLQHLSPEPQQILPGDDTIDTGGYYKFPQWSIQETREFLMIRAELDQSFMESRRNKLLWEFASTKMKSKGYHRSAEQCKTKWKNLSAQYKEDEAQEAQGILKQQDTYYNELKAIFTARARRKLWKESEGSQPGGSKMKFTLISSDDEEYDEESDKIQRGTTKSSQRKKRRTNKKSQVESGNTTSSSKDMKELLEDFMRKQTEMEMQWLIEYRAREEERKIREMEWRQKMEALERERMIKEMKWREKEEGWKVREEARAERRDALITQLLQQLRRE